MRDWPTTKLREVLRLDLDRVPVDASVTYPMVGVLSFGRGLFDREAVENGKTSYRFFHRLKADHVIMSQLFGWEGALALSEEKFAGKFVSPQFPTFLCDSTKLDRQFLGWLMRRPKFWEDLGSKAVGMGDRRRTLSPDALFASEIPLPSLPEQQRLVARIDELFSQINEARALRGQADKDNDDLLVTMAHRTDLDAGAKETAGWRRVRLSEVMREVDDAHRVDPSRSYPNIGIYSFGRGLFQKPPIDGMDTSAKRLRRIKAGQFIYSRLFAFEGAYGMVPAEFDGAFVSQEYPTFECNPQFVRAEFLAAYFRPQHVWRVVGEGSQGLGDRRQRVQPDKILAHEMWLPPIDWQNRIADVTNEVTALRGLHAETVEELDALLPSILDKAFKGEL